MMIREAVVAGSWYPGEAGACRRAIEAMRAASAKDRAAAAEPKAPPPAQRPAEADLPAHPVAGILPHAGWTFSGPTAVAALAFVVMAACGCPTSPSPAPSPEAAQEATPAQAPTVEPEPAQTGVPQPDKPRPRDKTVRSFKSKTFPDVASNKLQPSLQSTSTGANPKAKTEADSLFGFPPPDPQATVVFLVDRSASMTDAIEWLKVELKLAVRGLSETNICRVLFFSSGPPIVVPSFERPESGCSAWVKETICQFIDGAVAHGETDPTKAIEYAFAIGPDVIYLLTDGEFDRAVVDLAKRLNPEKKVKVHTIGYLYKTGEEILKQIAADSGGTYKFVSEADLEKLTQP